MAAVTVYTTGHVRIVFLQQLLAMYAVCVLAFLINPDIVFLHIDNVGVAAVADDRDRLFGWFSNKAIFPNPGGPGRIGVAAVAFFTENRNRRMYALCPLPGILGQFRLQSHMTAQAGVLSAQCPGHPVIVNQNYHRGSKYRCNEYNRGNKYNGRNGRKGYRFHERKPNMVKVKKISRTIASRAKARDFTHFLFSDEEVKKGNSKKSVKTPRWRKIPRTMLTDCPG